MKLFQIEEPDGSPVDPAAPGVAVGIEISPARGGAVAFAIGGNAEILPGNDGERRLPAAGLERAGRYDPAVLATALLGLRERAEKQLARPVTHAAIAAEPLEDGLRAALAAAAGTAGLTILRFIRSSEAAALAKDASADEAAVLGAAIAAEDEAARLPL